MDQWVCTEDAVMAPTDVPTLAQATVSGDRPGLPVTSSVPVQLNPTHPEAAVSLWTLCPGCSSVPWGPCPPACLVHPVPILLLLQTLAGWLYAALPGMTPLTHLFVFHSSTQLECHCHLGSPQAQQQGPLYCSLS